MTYLARPGLIWLRLTYLARPGSWIGQVNLSDSNNSRDPIENAGNVDFREFCQFSSLTAMENCRKMAIPDTYLGIFQNYENCANFPILDIFGDFSKIEKFQKMEEFYSKWGHFDLKWVILSHFDGF